MNDVDREPRQRIVAGAADMIRRRGLNATSIRDLAQHAGAPLGSTYHYFPGGKQQLAAEAVRYAADAIARSLRQQLSAGPLEGLRAFLALWRETLISSDFLVGCPVLAVCVEEPATAQAAARTAAAEAFKGWESLLADSLGNRGVDRCDAEKLASLIVAAVEGAVAMCRAERSTRPLDHVCAQLEAAVRSAIGG